MRIRKSVLTLLPGELAKVRSEAEILATLDKHGTLEGLPFTPEMLKYCGKRFKVLKRVKKVIIEEVGMGRMHNTVILDGPTCDGTAHGSCGRTCFLFWKESWLKRTDNDNNLNKQAAGFQGKSKLDAHYEKVPPCQSVSLIRATSRLPVWDFRQYLWDIESGVYGPFERMRLLLTSLSERSQKLLLGRGPLPFRGKLRKTPTLALDLQPGEFVEVRSKEEILRTLDFRGRNRGLEFSPEMTKYCGGRYRVLKRLDKMINERTAKMRQIPNTVILAGVTCDGKAHSGCPRTCFCLWREIWLRRAGQND